VLNYGRYSQMKINSASFGDFGAIRWKIFLFLREKNDFGYDYQIDMI